MLLEASGRFLEIELDRRIVFTWGWEMPRQSSGAGLIDRRDQPDSRRGDTIVRLIHRDLPDEALETHRQGWEHYIGRLASRAADEDPGPDPAVLS